MNYYNEIKQQLINNEINKSVKDYSKNKTELQTYYNVGKLLIEAQGGETRAKYGDKLIKEFSVRLTDELGMGYSIKNLKRMRQFYIYIQKGSTVSTLLSWSHYVELLCIDDISEINYYIKITEEQSLSVRKLRTKIKEKEYERLPESTKEKLINNDGRYEVTSFIKNPILISNPNNIDINHIKEKTLQRLIIEDIENIMKQLGEGFCYIDKEYKMKLGKIYNYIDILLYNYIYKCFIVIELKVTELKKEYIDQVQIYMNYIDKNLKGKLDNKTIGIIIVKENDEYIIKYSSDDRIRSVEYILI